MLPLQKQYAGHTTTEGIYYSGRDFHTLSQLQPIKTLHLRGGIAQWVAHTQEHKALYHISGSQHKPSQAAT